MNGAFETFASSERTARERRQAVGAVVHKSVAGRWELAG